MVVVCIIIIALIVGLAIGTTYILVVSDWYHRYTFLQRPSFVIPSGVCLRQGGCGFLSPHLSTCIECHYFLGLVSKQMCLHIEGFLTIVFEHYIMIFLL